MTTAQSMLLKHWARDANRAERLREGESIRRESIRRNARLRKARVDEAKKRGNHTLREWLELRAEFDGRCVRCQSWLGHTRDHIIPVSMGGSNAISNIQPLCGRCNSAKGTDTFDWAAFRREHGFDR